MKLSMKSLQAKKGRKTSDLLEEEEEDEGEVQIITLREEGETMAASDEALNAASLSTSVKETSKGIERYCIEDEVVPDDDFDATPPILGVEQEEKHENTDGPQTVVSKPPSRGAPVAAAPSKKQTVSDKQGERGKAKSTKTGLCLRKGRKRLSDSGSSSFQELPHSSSAQGPASKRPRIDVSNSSHLTEPSATKSSDTSAAARPELITNADLPTDGTIASDVMEVEPEVIQAPPTEPSIGATAYEMGSREASDSGDTDRFAKEAAVKPAVISLTGTEKIREIARKGVDFATNQKEKINVLREKSDEKKKLTVGYSSAVESAMETEDAAALPSAGRLQHKEVANTEKASLTSSVKVADDRGTKNTAFQLIRRVKADSWPPVKIQPSETPRNSSLQAPPGVLPAEHTKVLIQCFNTYIAKLAMAQRKVLWRIKWGQPVSSFNKAGVNSLTSGRRTRRSRASSIPYSEYALDLKSMAPLSRSKSSSPMISSKRSTPSKSPALSIGQQFSPSDEKDSDSDFEPSKAMTKQANSKKSNINTRAGKATMTTPTTKSQRAMRSRLTLGKRSPQLQERADKSLSPGVRFDRSLSPGVQFEREESPDILPPAAVHTRRQSDEPEKELSTKPSGRRLEFGVATEKSTLSVSPLPPPATSNQSPRGRCSASPQFQGGDDNVMMLDLTSPSPPLLPAKPQGPKTIIDRDGTEGDGFMTNLSDGEKDTLTKEKAVSSHARVSHDTTDDSDEEDLPQSVATSAAVTTGATSSSGSWLDSRKPPPSVQKTKSKRQPAKRTSNSKASNGSGAQSKKKAGGGGGGGRGRRPAKKTTSAALRIKALIQKSDSEAESEHSSLEDSEGDSSSKETVPKKPPGQKSKPKRRRTMDSTDDSEVTDMELEERGGERGETGSSRVLTSRAGPVGRDKGQKEVTGSNQGSHGLER